MDTFQWEAQYNDNTTLKQRDDWEDVKSAHSFTDIDRSKLQRFDLKDQAGAVRLSVIFDKDGEKLVWTRRGTISANGDQTLTHIVGKKGEFILALFQDGSVVARHNFVNDGLFDEVANG